MVAARKVVVIASSEAVSSPAKLPNWPHLIGSDERLPLPEVLAKAGDGNFLRSVAEAVLQLLLKADAEGVIGAGRHARSGERTTYRNGYRDRALNTRLGRLQLRIPKLRQGSYFPPFLETRKTSEKALVAVIQEAWVSGVGLILPWCNTAAMNLHLAAISADVAPGRHAALRLDQAGWHLSAKLAVPDNITIVPLPAKCPELNPQENIWQFMRDNWLSNRIFLNAEDLVDHCCDTWNKLEAQPWRIMSIELRDWANRF
jgi:hypothetical protein